MSNRAYVDLFSFKESGSGANVDIVTIEQGGENDYGSSRNRHRLGGRSTSPFRDRIQERYNRSLSPTGSPRLKRQTAMIPRSISPNLFSRTAPVRPTVKTSSPSKTISPIKTSPVKSTLNHSFSNTMPLLEHSAPDEEIRRLRFENLILQSKVETLENENKSLKERSNYNTTTLSDTRQHSRDMSRDMLQLKTDLDAATKQIDRLKKDNDDLTSQLYSLKVDRLEKPKNLTQLTRDTNEDWTGCQADAIEHLCGENQRLRETIFDMNEQKLHVHRLLEQHQNTDGLSANAVRKRLDSCQLDNEQLTEEKNRLLARLEESKKEGKITSERYDKLQEDYKKSLSQIANLEAQLLKYEKDDKPTRQSDTINNLTERCTQLQDRYDNREKEFAKQLQDKEVSLQNQIDMHVLKLQEIEDEIRRVSHVCDMMCQEKDNAIQTLQKQINTNAILSRSNEQLQNTVNEQSDRIRDLVYRQMRDTDVINELKHDFETLLQERNELEEKLVNDTQIHLRRLATLREQINIARLSFAAVTNLLEHDPSLDNEKREELLQQLAEVDTQLSTLQREILDMERLEAENTKTDLDDLTIQFLKKSEQCEELQTKLSNMEMDKVRLSKKQDELTTYLNDSNRANTDFEEKYEELKREFHKKQISNDTLTTQLNKVKIKLGILEDDRDVCEAQSRDLKRTNQQLYDNADNMGKSLEQVRKKLHAKESLSVELQGQVDELEGKVRKFLAQISQLQKGISRSTIQIGLLNEEMKVAINALLLLNREFDSELAEEHLEALQDICGELESLELALEKTLGSEYSLDMPLRGTSGEKISQLLQEIDFNRENIDQLKAPNKGKGDLPAQDKATFPVSASPPATLRLQGAPHQGTPHQAALPGAPHQGAPHQAALPGAPHQGTPTPGSPDPITPSPSSTHGSSTDGYITSDSPQSWVYPKSYSSSQDFDFK